MNNTKKLSIMALFLMSAVSAFANPILDALTSKLKWLFFDVAANDPNSAVFVVRILLFTVLFSVLYGVTSIGPMQHFPKNARTMLSVALSLLATIVIPAQLLITISNTYGALFTALLVGVPTVGIGYLVLVKLEEPTVANYSIKALVCFVLGYVLLNYANVAGSSAQSGLNIGNTLNWLTTILAVCFWGYAGVSASHILAQRGKETASGFSLASMKRAFGRSALHTKFDLNKANTDLAKVELDITNNVPNSLEVDIANLLRDSMTPLHAMHSELSAEVSELADSPKKTAAQTKLANMLTSVNNADAELTAIKNLADACIAAAAAPGAPAGPAKLIPADKTVAKAHLKLARTAINDAANAVKYIEKVLAEAAAPTP